MDQNLILIRLLKCLISLSQYHNDNVAFPKRLYVGIGKEILILQYNNDHKINKIHVLVHYYDKFFIFLNRSIHTTCDISFQSDGNFFLQIE